MEEVISNLESIPTFENLSRDDLVALAEICEAVHYPPGSVLAREGFDAEALFGALTGEMMTA